MWNKELSKLYKKVVTTHFFKTKSVHAREILRWYKKEKGNVDTIRNLSTGERILMRDLLGSVPADYYNKVMEEGIKYPGMVGLNYLGGVELVDITGVNGKPRPIPTDDGYEFLVDDYFSIRLKYHYNFSIRRTKIRLGLRPLIGAMVLHQRRSKMVKLAYENHPEGKFYKKA